MYEAQDDDVIRRYLQAIEMRIRIDAEFNYFDLIP